MTKQFNIRSQKAHEIALNLSRALGRPMHEVVEEALLEYQRTKAAKAYEDWLWGPALEEAQAAFKESRSSFKIEDLYDPETGLPC